MVVLGGSRTGWGDVYHFLVSSSWWALLGVFTGTYLSLNLLFALAYWWVGGVGGLEEGHFVEYLFFSVEAFATIGFGVMHPKGLGAHLLVTLEALLGILYSAAGTGLVFAKFSRPRARVLFSQVAVVARRNGVPTLMFRVANERRNHIVEAQIKVAVARFETTLEGERIRRIIDLPLVRGTSPLFILSWTVMHTLGPDSPLYGATAESMAREQAEFIITLTGLDESLGQTIHARHSYWDTEVVWNAKLVDILREDPQTGRRVVDYTRFHDVEPLKAPEAQGSDRPAETVAKVS
jgi:inward rectifier potassium channel